MDARLKRFVTVIAVLVCVYFALRFVVPPQYQSPGATAISPPVREQRSVSSSTRVTRRNFEALATGMSREEVTKLLGPVSTVKYESRGRSASASIYQWGSAISGFIICQFQDDKMTEKIQVSLKE